MKSARLITLLSALFLMPALHAQQTRDFYAEMERDITATFAEYRMYDFDAPAPSKAPKGYKPFYISHYGRHGARYALPNDIYEKLFNVFENGHSAGKLTAKGEEFRENYLAIYPMVAHRGGDLSHKGQEQHRMIAKRMYEDYKPVFKGMTRVEAVSTNIPRVLMSMSAFLGQIRELDSTVDINSDAGYVYYPALLPESSQNPEYRKPASGGAKAFSEEEEKEIMAGALKFAQRLFTDSSWLEQNYGVKKFQSEMRVFVVDLASLDFEPEYDFTGVFAEGELAELWKIRNRKNYVSMGRTPEGLGAACFAAATSTLDIIEKAEKDIASGDVQLRLRFGHDSGLMPLLAFMEIGGFGICSDDRETVDNSFNSSDIPMAANLQLVFYRSSRDPEILVKPVYCGRETTLPFEPVQGCYYRWSDFKEYYMASIERDFLSVTATK